MPDSNSMVTLYRLKSKAATPGGSTRGTNSASAIVEYGMSWYISGSVAMPSSRSTTDQFTL